MESFLNIIKNVKLPKIPPLKEDAFRGNSDQKYEPPKHSHTESNIIGEYLKDNYNILVLSGGGKRGITQLGFLYALHQKKGDDFFNNIDKYYGTSIGSLLSLLLIVGYKPVDIFIHICKSKINPTKNLNILNFVNNFGFFSLDEIFEELNTLIYNKIGTIPTMGELYKMTGKELTVVTYNLTKNLSVYINHKTHENLSCIEAVRMSCNIPILFEKYYYNGDLYIDGGFCDNYPIEYASKNNEDKNILGIKVGIREKEKKEMDIFMYLKLLLKLTFKDKNKYTNEKIDDIKIYISEDKKEWDFSSDTNEKFNLFSIGYNEGIKLINNKEYEKEEIIKTNEKEDEEYQKVLEIIDEIIIPKNKIKED